MNFILDFLPLLLFFGVFKYADAHAEAAAAFATTHFGFLVANGTVGKDEAPILLATLVVIAATLVQVAIFKMRGRKIHLILWVSLIMVVVLGGATVWFNDSMFIKWKPTLAYWTLALVFLLSQLLFHRDLLREMLGQELVLPDAVWLRLNHIWAGFFAFMGVLNLYVAYQFPTSSWATFKVFGATGLMLAFTLLQGVYISRHIKPDAKADT